MDTNSLMQTAEDIRVNVRHLSRVLEEKAKRASPDHRRTCNGFAKRLAEIAGEMEEAGW